MHFGKRLKSFGKTNLEFGILEDLSGPGDIDEQRVSRAGDFCHADNIVGVAEIPRLTRLTGRLRVDFAKNRKIPR